MKKIHYAVLALCFFPLHTMAQQDHFVYFQSENSAPFYIKEGNKIINSSSAGYLILPKIKDGEYMMIVGSPKNDWAEQQVKYRIENKDAGFLIKNFGDKKIGLFNLQSYNVIMAESVSLTASKNVSETNNDAFSNMLASVVNDSTIRQKDVPQLPAEKIVVKEEPLKAVKQAEVTKNKVVVDPTPPEVTTQQPIVVASIIKRRLHKKDKTGTELIYEDQYGNQKDTIRIFIPAEKSDEEVKVVEVTRADTMVLKQSEPVTMVDSSKVITPESLKKEINEPRPGKQPVFIEDFKNQKSSGGLSVNSDCKSFASEDDFFKLRKKMVAEKSDDDMVKVAKKIFKTKCFATDQVKNLSSLFLKDEGRYNFFDAAYPFVSDSAIFSTLENQLTDPYYITRFKAMIHH
ncbi:MAG: DUF4476 domain-containing protein [Ginsengibacter sp.]